MPSTRETFTSGDPGARRATPAARLRELLASPRPEYLLEAHNALSAKIAEEAGMAGLWVSSLTLSASYGLRDNSEITMTQALDVLESMSARVQIPILFDGDTGYGEFRHFQLLVERLERRGIAGVCIEDKQFPKTNSFLRSEAQELAAADEFCAKLRAGADARRDADFAIIARTEALITGLGLREAIARAERYAEAGADAILVHSKASTFAEVQAFVAAFRGRVPVVCVPTTYYGTPHELFERAGISLVIWANHLMRAGVAAMQRVAQRLAAGRSAREVEDEIAPVAELFRLQDEPGLAVRGQRYATAHPQRAVILAASRGEGLDDLTLDRPKCMIPIAGASSLERLVQHLRAEGVREICAVRGYQPGAVALPGLRCVDNPRWEETGEVGSLAAARAELDGDVVIAYGDVIFKRYVLHELLACEAELAIVVDASRAFLEHKRRVDRVGVSGRPEATFDDHAYQLLAIGGELSDAEADGQWIGLLRARGAGTRALADALARMLAAPGGERADMAALLRELLRAGAAIRVLYVHGDWIDINSLADVAVGNAAP
jgi:phosphoenolpyruvate phosphomutase